MITRFITIPAIVDPYDLRGPVSINLHVSRAEAVAENPTEDLYEVIIYKLSPEEETPAQ
jgi:hypothetical protein